MSVKTPGLGVALAVTGLSHFAKPQLYETMTAQAFPTNTRRFVYLNGAIETALGVGLVAPKTRKFALAGLGGYLGYLTLGLVANKRRG
ncbi:MAG: hypothetical protein FGM52_13240 [Mycobacterium sp.]|nr:hypothetical protein [Mycobacterium sp.]